MSRLRKVLYLVIAVALILNVNFNYSKVKADPIGVNIITDVEMYTLKSNGATPPVYTKDKNIEDADIRPGTGDRIQIDFKWGLPAGHTYKAGDTFTFQLPLNFFQDEAALSGTLDGGYGDFTISSTGEVVLTFSDVINGKIVTDGYFYVWRQFDSSAISGDTHKEIEFPFVGGVTFPIDVHFNSPNAGTIDKTGTANKGMNASSIEWVVDINKNEGTITNATFEDTLPAGLSLAGGIAAVEVYELTVNVNGTLVEGAKLTSPAQYDIGQTGDTFEIDFNGSIDKAYRIKYTTNIAGTTDRTFKNDAKVKSGPDIVQQDDYSVSVQYSKPLGKTKGTYNSATQTVNWAIQYNYNEQTIAQAAATLTDTYGPLDRLVANSLKVYEVTINADGTATKVAPASPLPQNPNPGGQYGLNVNDASGSFTLSFNNSIDKAYLIEYTTESKDRVYADRVLTNSVTYNGETKPESQTLREVIFAKSDGTIDYKNKEITWKFTINRDNKAMDELVITDTFPAGQHMEFIPDSVEVNWQGNGGGDTLPTVADSYLTGKTNYKEGFVLTLTGAINKALTITYKTKFDPTKINPLPPATRITEYTNSATLDWKEGGVSQAPITKTGKAEIDDYSSDNGDKTGTYDATKKRITWTIDVNYNLHPLTNAIIRDFYTSGQEIDESTFKVYNLTLTGVENGVEIGTEVTSPNVDFTVTEDGTVNGNKGFELKLGNINTAYRIVYQTELEDELVAGTYSNAARLYEQAAPTINYFSKSASVTPLHGGEYVSKSGVQGTGANSEFATWTVFINRSQSYINAGSTLTDTLSTKQILIPTSFELYRTNVAADGTVTKGAQIDLDSTTDYEIAPGDNTFTLTFKKAIEEPYMLVYKSFINAGDGEKISNDAEFSGTHNGSVSGGDDDEISVNMSGAGGGAGTLTRGNLIVTKVDAADTDEKLAGAVFELWDANNTMKLMERTTNGLGIATFEDLIHKNYILKEQSAPSGYVINPAYAGTGKLIEFRPATQEFEVTNQLGVWDVVLTKTDLDDASVIEDAVFKLQKHDGTSYVDVTGYESLSTDYAGKIHLANLAPGNYQFIEVTPARGYKPDVTPVPFVIDVGQTAAKNVSKTNERNVGSVELTKTDKFDGKLLDGVVFQLQTRAGVQIGTTNHTTDANGVITINNLKSGLYQLVEVTPHAGYVLNTTPILFEIVDDGVTVKVEAENVQTPGSTTLTKTVIGYPTFKLEHAKFRVLDANKQPAKDHAGNLINERTTDNNGEIKVDDLRPGNYFFEEVAPPSGYYFTEAMTPFTIVANQTTQVSVVNYPYIYVPPTPEDPDEDPEEPSEDPDEPEEPGEPGEEPENPGENPEVPGEDPDEPTTPGGDKEEVTTPEDTPVDGKVPGKDPKVKNKPKHGKVTIDKDGNWKYTPNPGYIGKDKFTVIIINEDGEEELIEIEVDVIPKGSVPDKGTQLPKTGESIPTIQWFGFALVLMAAGLLAIRWYNRKKVVN